MRMAVSIYEGGSVHAGCCTFITFMFSFALQRAILSHINEHTHTQSTSMWKKTLKYCMETWELCDQECVCVCVAASWHLHHIYVWLCSSTCIIITCQRTHTHTKHVHVEENIKILHGDLRAMRSGVCVCVCCCILLCSSHLCLALLWHAVSSHVNEDTHTQTAHPCGRKSSWRLGIMLSRESVYHHRHHRHHSWLVAFT